jgi:type IV pilus assembly protein PilE
MIALAVVAILAAVAYPSFMDSVRKGRRADAMEAISRIQLAQERWRANSADYAASITNAATETPPGLGLSDSSPDGHYKLELRLVGAARYTLVATAQGSQAHDTACKLIAVRVVEGNVEQGSGSAEVTWPDPGRCWNR